MTLAELVRVLEHKRDRLGREIDHAVARGDMRRAHDLMPSFRFACRQVQDALVGR